MGTKLIKGGKIAMINIQINELVAYGLKCGLVSEDDQIFVTNQLLDLFRLSEFHEEEILKIGH